MFSTTSPLSTSSSEEDLHRKRLAQLLRYIAGMHQTLDQNEDDCCFVREAPLLSSSNPPSDFFQQEQEGVLFSTNDFRTLLQLDKTAQLQPPPFSFYAAATLSRKRNARGAMKEDKVCWLRLTRLTACPEVASAATYYRNLPAVQIYLQQWLEKLSPNVRTIEQLLTLKRLEKAPKPSPQLDPRSRRDIRTFLQVYPKYLVHQAHQQTLEPSYNRLFEWIQEDHSSSELVWGLGHARWFDGTVWVNGPLLEVLVEVELAQDGALLVRPREHTGVSFHRPLLAALGSGGTSVLHQTVSELEPTTLAPGQPGTYVPLLKRIAVELSSKGRFQNSSNRSTRDECSDLIVTEAWCLFRRPKPSAVWARDAMAFCEQLARAESGHKNTPEMPLATWSLTLGPASLSQRCAATNEKDLLRLRSSQWWPFGMTGSTSTTKETNMTTKPLFPLPTSESQNRIANLLLDQKYPAVVCEGPPGTGKTHTIANLICAYLCQGKRVLVTCKNASALSVLRNRLPPSVRDLAVDVSASESSGMRQLQQTVERLAQRICSVSSILEEEKCRFLKTNVAELEKELASIDKKLSDRIESARALSQKSEGLKLQELSLAFAEKAPWLMKTILEWSLNGLIKLRDRVSLLEVRDNDSIHQVSDFTVPVSNAVVSKVARMAGSSWSSMKMAAQKAVASIPVVGQVVKDQLVQAEELVAKIRLRGKVPGSPFEWGIVLKALKHAQEVDRFENEVWIPFQSSKAWPPWKFHGKSQELHDLRTLLEQAVDFKRVSTNLNMASYRDEAAEARRQDTRRGALVSRLQQLSEELVDCTVVMELNRSFSVEAQSALIKFAQIAGKAKFNKSGNPAKMTARQRRRRQEYLAAFDQCCRFIPCWILTSAQISDYLPADAGLFDLVICDEASQVEVVTMLPGMLRGKQWLIVGDNKQVSPTECFISEDQMDSLRASLPSTPFSESFLPGQSFFDLCATAFPAGRVVLSEHFRCAQEIISFSNEQFYDGRLVPLRLPLASERIKPSLLDVKIRGSKRGKVNEKEADEIVKRVQAIVDGTEAKPRSIGIISLMGDEQSRLIRGRLLNCIGPQPMSAHNILVGDPPTFQGAERDIIFLSMVASPGSVPTQSQLMHFQRVNVAMSRARDQLVLVRSIELTDVPSPDDVKVHIMTFFQSTPELDVEEVVSRKPAHRLFHQSLLQKGFTVRAMSAVWPDGLCVEHGDARVALILEGTGESLREWNTTFLQQKAIERVGWSCLRVDAWSLLSDLDSTMASVVDFLTANGIEEPTLLYDGLEEETEESDSGENKEDQAAIAQAQIAPQHEVNLPVVNNENGQEVDVFVVSSDDDDMATPQAAPSGTFDHGPDVMDAAMFGQVVDMEFLREDALDENEVEDATQDHPPRGPSTGMDVSTPNSDESKSVEMTKMDSTEDLVGDLEDSSDDELPQRKRKRRRLQRYQRDGRWYPGPDRSPSYEVGDVLKSDEMLKHEEEDEWRADEVLSSDFTSGMKATTGTL